jgi:polyphosphate kinase 2 (PPK2 family)
MRAYEDMMHATSTEAAPWYVVPSDRKWFRNYVLADTIVAALEKMGPKYPVATVDPRTFTLD